MAGCISVMTSCQNATDAKQTAGTDTVSKTETPVQAPLKEKVLTKAEQDALTVGHGHPEFERR